MRTEHSSPPRHRQHRGLIPATVLAAAVLLMPACAKTDSKSSVASGSATTSGRAGSGTTAKRVTSGHRELCDAWIDVDKVASQIFDESTPPNEIKADALRMNALLTRDQDPPTELTAPLGTLTSALAAVAAGGDTSQLEADSPTVAFSTLGNWVHDHCGFTKVDLTFRDYAYEGMPATLPEGPVSFKGTSQGQNAHMIVLIRLNKDVRGDPVKAVTDAIKNATGDPFEALTKVGKDVVDGAFTTPGGTGSVTARLTRGTYVILCPRPVGYTGAGAPPENAPAHVMVGMIKGFEVA
ncbi:MAG: hypothetical protein R2698_07105 [Microthrixaceae bacterium]